MNLLVGTYSEPILFGTGEVFCGKGRGLYLCSFSGGDIQVRSVLPLMNPSYLTADEKLGKVYAVNEGKQFHGAYGGGVTEIDLAEDGSLTLVRQFGTEGTDPCHIALSPHRDFLGVANFADGSVSFFRLANGSLTGEMHRFCHEGTGPNPVRQKGPHAHSVIFDSEGHVYVPDLGIDTVVCYDVNAQGFSRNHALSLTLPAGSGPRFGVFSEDENHFYVIDELASNVCHFEKSGQRYECREIVSALPEGVSVDNICSDIHMTPDGRYLYASNRGHDSLAAFAIQEDGSLRIMGWTACHGKTPRNFAVSPDGQTVLVGNQDSDTISIFDVGKEGMLTFRKNIDFPTPVCIRFLEREYS